MTLLHGVKIKYFTTVTNENRHTYNTRASIILNDTSIFQRSFKVLMRFVVLLTVV